MNMKTVYADVVFAINFCIDYLLLYVTSSVLFLKVKLFKIALAALIGGLYAVVIAVTSPMLFVRIASLLFMYTFMIIIVFGRTSTKIYIKIFAVFILLSVLFGGFLSLLITNCIKGSLSSIALVALAVMFSVAVPVILRIFRVDIVSTKIKARIAIDGVAADFVLLCDSGNLLTDTYTGSPVILLGASCRKSFPMNDLDVNDARFLLLKTVSSTDIVEVVIPDEVVVGKKRVSASVGFVCSDCFKSDGCDGVIPSVLVDNY